MSIEDNNFYDGDIIKVETNGDDFIIDLHLENDPHIKLSGYYLQLSKPDVIALAKHFELTAEDLADE